MSTPGSRLREEVEAKGVSNLARTLGIARNTLYNWSEKGNVPLDKLFALGEAGVDVTYVLSGIRASPAIAAQAEFMIRAARMQEPDGAGPLHDMLPEALAAMGEHAAQRMPRLEPIIARLSTCGDEDFALVEAMLARIFGDTAAPQQK